MPVRVLFIDDEAAIRRLATMSLTQAGYEVVTAEDGPSGLAQLESLGGEVAAVILDMTMPGMGGEEVLRRIREKHPDLPVLLSSGHAPSSLAALVDDDARTHFLAKPYRIEKLLRHVGAVLDGPAG